MERAKETRREYTKLEKAKAVVVTLIALGGMALGACTNNSGTTPGLSPNVTQGSSGNSSNSGTGSSPTSQPQSTGAWSSGQQIDANYDNSLNSVSCPTASFCVAVGDTGGNEYTYSNS